MAGETAAQETIAISDQAWRALEGAYDLQVHAGHDVIAGRIDDIVYAKESLVRDMRSRLTTITTSRRVNSSHVAIGRHSSTTAIGHVERLRADRPEGHSDKHP